MAGSRTRPLIQYGEPTAAQRQDIEQRISRIIRINADDPDMTDYAVNAGKRCEEEKRFDDNRTLINDIVTTVTVGWNLPVCNRLKAWANLKRFWMRWGAEVPRRYEPNLLDDDSYYSVSAGLYQVEAVWMMEGALPLAILKEGEEIRRKTIKHRSRVKIFVKADKVYYANSFLEECVIAGEWRRGIEYSDILTPSPKLSRSFDPAKNRDHICHQALYWWCKLQLGDAEKQREGIERRMAELLIMNTQSVDPEVDLGGFTVGFCLMFWAQLSGLVNNPWKAIRNYFWLDE